VSNEASQRTPAPGGSAGVKLDLLLDSILERYRKGERPSLSEYTEKYPELAERIREVFPALELLGGVERKAGRGDGGPPGGSTSAPSAIPSPEVRRLGEYRLIRELGRGGMGVVYEAEQEPLGRRVALKVLPFHSLMDERRLDRFRREARAAASLKHPNIVAVHGMGDEGGIHYYSMDLVEGQSLEKVLLEVRRLRARGTSPATVSGASSPDDSLSTSIAFGLLGDSFGIPTPQALVTSPCPRLLANPLPATSSRSLRHYHQSVVRLVSQAAQGLSYAHARGVLHRDIKPSNLMVDMAGRAWVADFGLAKLADTEDLTRSSEIVGTFRYMAPEQGEGRPDPRSDVYSLGLTLYELLTLEIAFPRRKAHSKNLKPESPPAPRKVDRSIPRPLETIVLKAIQEQPEERYQSAAELAEDLQRFLNADPIRARLPGPAHRLNLYLRRRRLAVGVAGALAASMAAAVSLWTTIKPPRNPECLVAIDLDGDKHIDFVTANSGSNTLSFLLNDGKGDFTVGGHSRVAEIPLSAAAADFDGDGRPDLAVASNGGRDLILLRNAGNGSFEKTARIALGVGSNYLAAADLDGDQKIDLAVSVRGNAIYILRNLGCGLLEKSEVLETEGAAGNLSLADLDNDGDQDVACSNPVEGQKTNLAIFMNTGSGRFSLADHYDLGGAAWGIRPADLDGDGDLDLAVAFNSYARIDLLWNDGAGRFPVIEKIALNSLSRSIASGDFNGDGNIDLACAGSEGSYVCVLTNKGNGKFGPPAELSGGLKPQWIETADLDGDGDLDLATANFQTNDVTLFFNDGNGHFQRTRTVALGPWWRPDLLWPR
jgi:serine/threonine protein kinase